MNYTCGFVFDSDFKNVLLLHHAKFNMLNGVGGKAHPDERRARDTMARECYEETGLKIDAEQWVMFSEYIDPKTKNRVLFFYTRLDDISDVPNVTSYDVAKVVNGEEPAMPDVPWLLVLARTWRNQELDCVVAMAQRRGDPGWRKSLEEL